MTPLTNDEIRKDLLQELAGYTTSKLEKEVADSHEQAKQARIRGERIVSAFHEGRIAGLITAAKIITGEL